MVNAKAKVNHISGPETCDKPPPVLQETSITHRKQWTGNL